MYPTKRILIAWDYDQTLSTEYMEEPLFNDHLESIREVHGNLAVRENGKSGKQLICLESGADYFSVVKTLQPDTSRGIGYLQQMLWDNDKVFSGKLTREYFRTIGERVKLAPGVPDGLRELKLAWANQGVEVYHAVISVGIRPIIEGSDVGSIADIIQASDFIYDSTGKICGIQHAVTPFSKNEELISIIKGDKSVLDKKLMQSEYAFDYRDVICVGDGFTDVSKFSFVSKNGGVCIAVYPPGDAQARDTVRRDVGERVHCILPRNYNTDSITYQEFNSIIKSRVMRTCRYDPRVIARYADGNIEDSALYDLTRTHIDSCKECMSRFVPVIR